MIVDELGRIPMSPNLAAALQRASDYAAAQMHREVTLEHLLLALTQDPDAGQVLEASQVDLSRLEADVSTHLGRIEERFQPGEPLAMTVAGELKRILEASAAAAAKGRRKEINGAIVLAAVVGDGRTIAAHMLRAQGLTFEEAIRVLRAPAAPPPRPAAPPPPPAPSGWNEAPASSPASPVTEDILATARERVQTRTHPPVRAPEPERHGYEPAFEPMVPPPQPSPAPAAEEPAPDFEDEAAAEPSYDSREPEWQREPVRPAPSPVAPPQVEPHWAPPPMPPPMQAEPTLRPHGGPALPPPPPRPPQLHPPYAPPPIPASRPVPPPPPQPAGPGGMRPSFPPRPPMTPGATSAGAAPPALPPAPSPMHAPPPPPSRDQLSPPAYAPWPEPPPEPPRDMRHERAPPAAAARAGDDRRRSGPASVEAGQLAENVPRRMRAGVPVVVEARIAKASIKAFADGMSGSVHHHEVQVTKAMSVKLRAPDGGFWIETVSPETQWIESIAGLMSDDFASWRWTVTPRWSGRKKLQLVVSARTVGVDGLTAETALPDQIIDVRVAVNWGQTAKRWGGWVAAAIAGGLIQRFGEGAIGDGLKSLIALVTG